MTRESETIRGADPGVKRKGNSRCGTPITIIPTLVLASFFSGCATPQGLNPTDAELEIEHSNSNTIYNIAVSMPQMEGFEQVVTDMLKELIPQLTVPIGPANPGSNLPLPPPVVTPTPPSPDPTPPPVGEHPIPPGAARDYTTLFKESTSDNGQPSGRGAVLVIDSTHWDNVAAVSIGGTAFTQSTDWDAGHNGWREHWRNGEAAQSFHGRTVSVVLKDSTVLQDIIDGSGGALYRDTLTLQ